MIDLEDQAEPELDGRKNVVRKNVQARTDGKIGEIAHYHKKENAVESWEEPCYFVKHRVHDAKGYSINEKRFAGGDHIIPQCTADYLAWQESEHLRYEDGIYRGKNHGAKVVGSF